MLRLDRSAVGFGLRIIAPALVVLAAAITSVVVSLHEMSYEVDRIQERATERSTRAALAAFVDRLRTTHGDYAVWDDAVVAFSHGVDAEFVDSNFRSSTELRTLFDTAALVDERGRQLFAYADGEDLKESIFDRFPAAIEKLIAALPQPRVPYGTLSAFLIDRTGVLYAIAVGPLLPATGKVAAPVHPHTLIIGRRFDDAAVRQLASEFVIHGLKLVPKGDPNEEVVIFDALGRPVAGLTWRGSGAGEVAFSRVTPTALTMMALLGLTVLALSAIALHNQLRLQERERQAQHSAAHDNLSGLPNRAALLKALRFAVANAEYVQTSVVVIYLDLDGFKEVNDSYGHETGDRLIRKVAQGFSAVCGRDGVLARVGGDEFALILTRPEAIASADAIAKRMLEFLSETFVLDGRSITIGTSIGIARMETGVSAEELLRRADVAMYQAKESGRNRICWYNASMDAARSERSSIAAELWSALARDGLYLVYQPIVDAQDRRVIGVEALLRWRRSGKPDIPPDVFVPIAEESGLIDRLGHFVLRRALEDVKRWPGLWVSVNLSPAQFRNPGFEGVLAAVLSSARVGPERLQLEMTETHLVAHPERAARAIAAIRELGVSIALDDFGTGYSSIGYLRRFAFDKLKIDRSLLAGIEEDPSAQRLVHATVALGNALGLTVTAEGVESEDQATLLAIAGCSQLQGWALGRPMSAEAMTEFLRRDREGAVGVVASA